MYLVMSCGSLTAFYLYVVNAYSFWPLVVFFVFFTLTCNCVVSARCPLIKCLFYFLSFLLKKTTWNICHNQLPRGISETWDICIFPYFIKVSCPVVQIKWQWCLPMCFQRLLFSNWNGHMSFIRDGLGVWTQKSTIRIWSIWTTSDWPWLHF